MYTTATSIPIQVFNVCNTTGDIEPIRFRYEDKNHVIQTVEINQILSRKNANYVGQECIIYICKTLKDNTINLYEIKYLVLPHKWELVKKLL